MRTDQEIIDDAATKASQELHLPLNGCVDKLCLLRMWKALYAVHGGDAELIPAARHVNDSMPGHVSKRIREETLETSEEATVGLLGLAFKENVSDTRNSPTVELLQTLTSTDVNVIVYDPLVDESYGARRTESMKEFLETSDIIVLCVGHDQIVKELQESDLSEKIFFDPRNMMPNLRQRVKKYIGLSV